MILLKKDCLAIIPIYSIFNPIVNHIRKN
jgi:hypothetical protein